MRPAGRSPPSRQGLAEQSGGRLVLKSRIGEGTTAELWFPVAERGAFAAEREGAPEPVTDRRHLSVLAVDDDPLVLNNTAALLADLGHVVLTAESAAEALDILRDKRVDLVLTDHAMPQMTGAQLAAMVNARWPTVPIILATGFAELPPGTGAGLPRLAKPFTQEELARAIAEASPVV